MTIRERIAAKVEEASVREVWTYLSTAEIEARAIAVTLDEFATWLDERAKGHDRAVTEFRRQGRAMAAVDSVSQMTECRDIAAELRGGGK